MRFISTVPFLALLLCLPCVGCSGKSEEVGKAVSKVGESCLPSDEEAEQFPGYAVTEVSVDLLTFLHEDRIGPFCFIDHFQGRASCPYGQTDADIASLGPTDPARCRVPLADGTMTTNPVLVAVVPQLVERRPEKTIYYTCACSGTDSGREYCACPEAMHCEAQTLTQKFGITGLCVRDDSAYDPAASSATLCGKTDVDASADCGNNRQNP